MSSSFPLLSQRFLPAAIVAAGLTGLAAQYEARCRVEDVVVVTTLRVVAWLLAGVSIAALVGVVSERYRADALRRTAGFLAILAVAFALKMLASFAVGYACP